MGINKSFNIKGDYFNVIDSEIKAYLLGFLFVNSTFYEKKKDKISLYCSIAKRDDSALYLIAKELNSEYCILTVNKNSLIDSHKLVTCTSINAMGSSLYKNLSDIGCVRNRSERLFPNISEEYIHHFIRGLFDFGGTIYLSRKKKLYVNTVIQFRASENVLFHIKDILNITNRITKVNGKKFSAIEISSKSKVKQLYDFMYNDATMYIKRKKDVFDKCFKKR